MVDSHYWQLATELEKGRNHVLRMVAQNVSLKEILQTLCQKSQIYNSEMLCSILRLDNDTKTLHPIASVSLPDFYCQALDGVNIGAGVGSCGTAAFTKKRVVVENINTHPYWNQYKELALSAGVQACWSEPIIGAEGIVFGTFAMYYRTPQSPTEEDLNFIELSANLAAVVFDNNSNRDKLIKANKLLSQTIDQRNEELELLNHTLEKEIEKQSAQNSLDIESEKLATTYHLISGFSHEISSPLGNALTAASAADDKLAAVKHKLKENTLSRNVLSQSVDELIEFIKFNREGLLKADKLLAKFKEIDTQSFTDHKSNFSMKELLKEVQKGTESKLGNHLLFIQCSNFELHANKEQLWQIFNHLIENSITHGFKDTDKGTIHINVTDEEEFYTINFQDNGCGIAESDKSRVFEPFYSSSRSQKHLGLGLNIISNLISHNLKGRIELVDSPIGVRFQIICLKR